MRTVPGISAGLAIVAAFGAADPMAALEVRVSSGKESVVVADNGEGDANAEKGSIQYSGQINGFDVRLLASEEGIPGQQHGLTLSGVPEGSDPQQLIVINGGDVGSIAFEVTSSAFEALGPRTRTQMHYQGRFLDTADVNTRPNIARNRLSVQLGGVAAGEIDSPPLQTDAQEQVFDQTAKPAEVDGEAKTMTARLDLTMSAGNALALEEARLTTTALESEFPLTALLWGGGAAVAVLGAALFLALRPRRRQRS
jgi:hypothetical protein